MCGCFLSGTYQVDPIGSDVSDNRFQESENMKIFIGSSSETLSDVEMVASWIEEAGHTPIPWNDARAFSLGTYTFAGLTKIAKEVDAAVFIFSEDDNVWYRSDTAKQPRDNVMIEYGLFIGTLGQERVVFCRKGNPRTATDLLGVVYVNIGSGYMSTARYRLRSWLNSVSGDANGVKVHPLLERLNSPFQALGKRTLFLQGTELLQHAETRVALVANTPVPIVGTRPYGEPRVIAGYEQDQFNTFWSVIDKASTSGKPEIRCVACVQGLRDELMITNKVEFRDTVAINLRRFDGYVRKGDSCRLYVRFIRSPLSYLVTDNDFIIWFKDGTGESVWITANNEAVADALYDLTCKDVKEMPIDALLDELALALAVEEQ